MTLYRDLRSFISALDDAGELRRVAEPTSPVLEIARITDRESKSRAPRIPSQSAQITAPRFHDRGGQALFFEHVEGSDFPVLINAFGSYSRMETVLGDSFESIAARIGQLVKPEPPRGFRDALRKARQFAPLLRIGPKRVRSGACQEVVRTGNDIDLTRLPMLRCWELDGDLAGVGYPADTNAGVKGAGHPDINTDEWDAEYRGRYITFAGIHTIHADDSGATKPASHNIGMYRVQLVGKDRLAMHWHMHHDGAAHWRSWKKRGEPMPIAIVLGGEAVLPYAATAPLPPGISELLMAGFLNGRGIRMVRAKTVPLWVPANAEIVIEGWVRTDCGEIGWEPGDDPLGDGAFFEGPFGDHTGFYSMPDRYPIVEVSAVTHRRDAVFPATIVGLPPQEDYFLGKATERLFLPLLRTLIHDIEDYDLPMFGAFHNCALIRIDKQYPMQARRVMHAVWGAGQMAWTKTIFVVDKDTDVHDASAVLRAASAWCRPGIDTESVRGPLDILDHAAPRLGAGTKIGFDCTARWDGEQAGAGLPDGRRASATAEQRESHLARVRAVQGVLNASYPEELGGWCFVSYRHEARTGREIAEELARFEDPPPFTVVLGSDVDVQDSDAALFHWCANSDPGRDAVWGDGCVVFDATPKRTGGVINGEPVRAWPPVIEGDRMGSGNRDQASV